LKGIDTSNSGFDALFVWNEIIPFQACPDFLKVRQEEFAVLE
jgi:hypothetical protein